MSPVTRRRHTPGPRPQREKAVRVSSRPQDSASQPSTDTEGPRAAPHRCCRPRRLRRRGSCQPPRSPAAPSVSRLATSTAANSTAPSRQDLCLSHTQRGCSLSLRRGPSSGSVIPQLPTCQDLPTLLLRISHEDCFCTSRHSSKGDEGAAVAEWVTARLCSSLPGPVCPLLVSLPAPGPGHGRQRRSRLQKLGLAGSRQGPAALAGARIRLCGGAEHLPRQQAPWNRWRMHGLWLVHGFAMRRHEDAVHKESDSRGARRQGS